MKMLYLRVLAISIASLNGIIVIASPTFSVKRSDFTSNPLPGEVRTLASGTKLYGATSASTPNPSALVKKKLSKRSYDLCGDSTFINQSSTGSPLISDCEQLRDDVYGDSAVWTVPHCYGNCYWDLADYGSCIFGASCDFAAANQNCLVGNSDIGDLTRDTIIKFSWFTQCAGKGWMTCEGTLGGATLGTAWAIY